MKCLFWTLEKVGKISCLKLNKFAVFTYLYMVLTRLTSANLYAFVKKFPMVTLVCNLTSPDITE